MRSLPSWTRSLASLGTLVGLSFAAAQLLAAPAKPLPSATPDTARELAAGRQALATKQYAEAARHLHLALRSDPGSIPARLALADAELALRQYEPAEFDYRQVVAAEPQLWVAHKNLVIVEAALGRWEEFDRERTVLRLARQREAEGLSAHESDVIDSFTIAGRHWIVREYFEPVGRSQARYNFESFAPTGRVEEYISLEPQAAAESALAAGVQVPIGPANSTDTAGNRYALNWYTGKSHGTIRTYPPQDTQAEPGYEQVRADVLHWLRSPRQMAGATH